MMSRLKHGSIIVMLCLCVCWSHQTNAAAHFVGFEDGQKGVGLLAGVPFTLRLESWTQWKESWFFDAGYQTDKTALLGASYAFYVFDVMDHWRNSTTVNSLLLYYGPGVFAGYSLDDSKTDNRIRAGARVFAGFQYLFGSGRFSLKGEVGPALNVLGERAIALQGGLGFVYYFGEKSFKRANDQGDRSLYFDQTDFQDTKSKSEFDLTDEERSGKVQPLPGKRPAKKVRAKANRSDEFGDEPKAKPMKVAPAKKAEEKSVPRKKSKPKSSSRDDDDLDF